MTLDPATLAAIGQFAVAAIMGIASGVGALLFRRKNNQKTKDLNEECLTRIENSLANITKNVDGLATKLDNELVYSRDIHGKMFDKLDDLGQRISKVEGKIG